MTPDTRWRDRAQGMDMGVAQADLHLADGIAEEHWPERSFTQQLVVDALRESAERIRELEALADDSSVKMPSGSTFIGWFHPHSRRFVYDDVKEHNQDRYSGYTMPVYAAPPMHERAPDRGTSDV